MIFGVLSTPQGSAPGYTLAPPSPYARRLPLYTHPSTAVNTPVSHLTHWNFRDRIQWAWDPIVVAKNSLESPTRTNETSVGGGGTEWGAWFELKGAEERITTPALAYLVDLFISTHLLIPKSERGKLGFRYAMQISHAVQRTEWLNLCSWFATVTLTIEFKFPIPTTIEFARRTVGLYSSSRYINEPRGRHDTYVEVWTAPSNIGEGKEEAGWRDKQVCLANSTQMSVVVPRPRSVFEQQSEIVRL